MIDVVVVGAGPVGMMLADTLLRAGRWLAIETRPTFDAEIDRLGAVRVLASDIAGAGDVRALLVRPDGYIAWASDGKADAALATTIDAWA